ncbi:lasso peptide biosynthesis B2 protein [Sphingosinicella sp. LHD-64]|uniref:lasso peptide biosynthesis B2 protein n=1 Tax=Sphingosinicella sp. LHD-64 TaxID=3072139 RepID=UPI00280F9353|nr:lasso peptide biosynthesis B2 protein [Sphingosinicella sp. LHD-64]MDQ8757405.1 lasso peptide biosynthesis B2 protein [Sphingosinicella sp. LHD-64]
MPFKIRRGLSWCRCAGRIVFLDLAADRYFCLSPCVQPAFERMLAGDDRPDRAVQALIDQRVLVPAGSGSGDPRPAPRPARGDLLAGSPLAAPPAALVAAFAAHYKAMALLRCYRLADIVGRIEADRRRPGLHGEAAREKARRIAAAFAIAGAWLRVDGRCLPRALALLSVCRRHGVRADLVFGVRLDPFTAHCWVQLGDEVLVGDYEQVRVYTPILAVR